MTPFQSPAIDIIIIIIIMVPSRWALRQKEKKNGGTNGRREDVLDRLLAAIDEREWGPGAIRQLRDEVRVVVVVAIVVVVVVVVVVLVVAVVAVVVVLLTVGVYNASHSSKPLCWLVMKPPPPC